MKKPARILVLFCLSALGCVVSLTSCMFRPFAPPASTPTPTPVPTPTLDNREHLQVFETVWDTVNETYFDPQFGGVDWAAVHDKYAPLIAAAPDEETFYDLLNQMLWELNVSHVGVGPAEVWPSIEPVAWESGEIGIDVRLLDDQAVITRVETDSPADQAGMKTGFVVQKIDGVSVEQILAEMAGPLSPPRTEAGRMDILTRHLLSRIYGEPGTRVTLTYLDEQDAVHEQCIERMQRPRKGYMLPPAYLEFESRRLENSIGYIRFNTFHKDLIPDMVQAVDDLKDAPGIIIDLRGNPGGDPTTAEQLAAQFLEGQVSFGSFRIRDGSIPRMVEGKNIYTGSLIILIDALSFSGSEYFASNMQTIARAVIVGERSPGGLTGMNITRLPNDAILGYPVAQLITSDSRVLEGFGVIPDIPVPLERNQLLEGVDAQLQAAIQYIVESAQ